MSTLKESRLQAEIALPTVFNQPTLKRGTPTESIANSEAISGLFPHTYGQPQIEVVSGGATEEWAPQRVGVVLSGGQAPGGHNVIAGLFDALGPKGTLVGFLGGPSGVIDGQMVVLDAPAIDRVRNLGGFDIIGSGRTKIETPQQLESALAVCKREKLDGLVVIGGDDSNTNAAVLAEYFIENGCATKVIGVPKTIDGDLKSAQIEISFGHDTACKVYSELIGNLMRDAQSARKYTHFVKLMGRSASHVTLECALQTHPNVALISEEVAARQMTLEQVVDAVCDTIQRRQKAGLGFGVVLVPEGLIEFIPEVSQLIGELNALLAATTAEKAVAQLSATSRHCFATLPKGIQEQLLLDRDSHGNVQVSRIETEQLLMALVKERLGSLSAVHHFFGYEGRSAMPSVFDCHYCYALGATAALLVQHGVTGYMSTVGNLGAPVSAWTAGGTPLTRLMNMEERTGTLRPVIQKALVDLDGPAFGAFAKRRQEWATGEDYGYPGPMQFFGPAQITGQIPLTLAHERG